ncbi:MAG: zinc-binding dehydrogenase, partial [Gaiellaceae bacterium]
TGRARSREPVLELGADVFVDVEREPLEASGEPAVVLDLVGGDLLARTRPLVAADGVVVSAVDPATPEIAAELGLRGVYFVVEPNRDGLAELTQRIDAGELQPIVGELLPLERKRAGAIPGKSVLAVAEAS